MICVFQSPLPARPPAGPLSWELLHSGAIFLHSVGSKSKANRKLKACEGVHEWLSALPLFWLRCLSEEESVCKAPSWLNAEAANITGSQAAQ